jgi:glycine oxidase
MTVGSSNRVDCLVAGGGLIGLLCALYLAREGFTVTVLERGELCRESSWAGGGILSPLVPWEYPDAVTQLVAWSQQHYPLLANALHQQTGIDPEWTRSGLLMLDTPLSADIRAWADRHAVEVQAQEPAAVQADEPSLAAATGPALLLPAVAQVRNPRLCTALREQLQQRGVGLHEHSAVRRLLVARGRIQGVDTEHGRVGAERVVIAGGAWSAELLQGTRTALPVTPVRGQMILFETRPGLLRHIVLSDGYYLIPRRDGLVLAGSTLEYTGFDKATTPEARELLTAQAVRIAPVLADYPVIRHWAGLRPGTRDGIPFICEHSEISGLYLNAGHFRNGVVTGPASARLLVDRMLGRHSFTEFAPYRL